MRGTSSDNFFSIYKRTPITMRTVYRYVRRGDSGRQISTLFQKLTPYLLFLKSRKKNIQYSLCVLKSRSRRITIKFTLVVPFGVPNDSEKRRIDIFVFLIFLI